MKQGIILRSLFLPFGWGMFPLAGVTDEQKKLMASTLAELSKASSQGAKVIAIADSTLTSASSIREVELLDMNLGKLRQISEEAEEVNQSQ